jgi:hypothetical protein
VSSVDDEIAAGPVPIVEVDVVHAPDISVDRVDRESEQLVYSLQHRLSPVIVARPDEDAVRAG